MADVPTDRARATIDDGLTAAIGTFRLAALVWLVGTTALSFRSFDEPVGAAICVAAACAATVVSHRPSARRRASALALELGVGAGLIVFDPWVYADDRVVSLGGVWPIAGVLAAASLGSSRLGVVAGLGLGAARVLSEVLYGDLSWSLGQVLATSATGALLALTGWAAGWAVRTMREAEDRAAHVAAADAVAAELHDGVLQTLAVIQRRSEDPELVALARTQEADLRRYLQSPSPTRPDGGATPLDLVLREAASAATRRFGLRCEIAAVPPLPAVDGAVADALSGAMGECLANVAKHAGVDHAVVFAEREPDGGDIVVSVTDRGQGFDPDREPRRGLEHSVERRLVSVGGHTTVQAQPGGGTTVELRIPHASGGTR